MKKAKITALLLAAVFALSMASCAKLTPEQQLTKMRGNDPKNPLLIVYDDMNVPNEHRPSGTDADWATKPRLGMGNTPKDGWTAFVAWGQVYVPQDVDPATGLQNPAANTRVEIKNMKAYILSKKTGKWSLVQSSEKAGGIGGDAYEESFADNKNKPTEIRPESDGGYSVIAGNGYNFHFWPKGARATIDPTDIDGVITMVDARLVLDDPNGTDDRGTARYMMSMGADYWKSPDADWDQWKTNGDAGIGRFRFVTKDWQTFYMCTNATPGTLDKFLANPPPTK